MIGVPILCHTTDFQRAFGMDTTEQYVNFSRAKFIRRLLSNASTREIIIQPDKKYFNRQNILTNERTFEKLIDLVCSEIDKYKCLKKERKDNKSIVN
jgi:hypothetical protein